MSARRLRIAYFSPLPPARSGIADYSRELLPAFARHLLSPQQVSECSPGSPTRSTGRLLMNIPNIASEPGRSVGRPDTVVP